MRTASRRPLPNGENFALNCSGPLAVTGHDIRSVPKAGIYLLAICFYAACFQPVVLGM